MNGKDLQGLATRLERLERENRWLKLGVVVVLLGIAAAVLMGQAMREPKVVTAEQFVLRDSAGEARAVLTMSGDGPGLTLFGEDGDHAKLRISPAGPELTMYDQGGHMRANLGVQPEGPSLTMWSSGMENRSQIYAFLGATEESGGLALYGPEDKLLSSLPAGDLAARMAAFRYAPVMHELLLKKLNNAVVLYRNDVGRYPERLEDIALSERAGPKGYQGPYVIPPVPNDPVTGKPFAYDPGTGEVTAPE